MKSYKTLSLLFLPLLLGSFRNEKPILNAAKKEFDGRAYDSNL